MQSSKNVYVSPLGYKNDSNSLDLSVNVHRKRKTHWYPEPCITRKIGTDTVIVRWGSRVERILFAYLDTDVENPSFEDFSSFYRKHQGKL